MRIKNFPRNNNSFPFGQEGRNLWPTRPNNKFSQSVFMETLRPETLFRGRAYKIHKTNPQKGSPRFWHFYPRKITRRDQSAETQPDNAPIWFMTPSIEREQAALGSFPNYKQRTYLGFGISQYISEGMRKHKAIDASASLGRRGAGKEKYVNSPRCALPLFTIWWEKNFHTHTNRRGGSGTHCHCLAV